MLDTVSERVPDPRYRGMNPEFVKRVWTKRREAEAKKQSKEKAQARSLARKIRTVKHEDNEVAAKIILDDIRAHYRIHTFGEFNSKPNGQQIIRQVCAIHNMDVDIVLGQSRNRAIVAVRQEAMAAVYRIRPDYSLPMIGRLFNRDHTTIIAALMKLGVHVSQTGGKRQYSHPGNLFPQLA